MNGWDDHSKKKVGGQILVSTNLKGRGSRGHDKARKQLVRMSRRRAGKGRYQVGQDRLSRREQAKWQVLYRYNEMTSTNKMIVKY